MLPRSARASARSWSPQEYGPGGRFERLDGWLDSNMGRFGFFRPYATWQGGVRPEPWHLSLRGRSRCPALQVLSLEVLREAIEEADMPGKTDRAGPPAGVVCTLRVSGGSA